MLSQPGKDFDPGTTNKTLEACTGTHTILEFLGTNKFEDKRKIFFVPLLLIIESLEVKLGLRWDLALASSDIGATSFLNVNFIHISWYKTDFAYEDLPANLMSKTRKKRLKIRTSLCLTAFDGFEARAALVNAGVSSCSNSPLAAMSSSASDDVGNKILDANTFWRFDQSERRPLRTGSLTRLDVLPEQISSESNKRTYLLTLDH